MRLLPILVPIAYAGILLKAVVHEVVGHGVVALVLGGNFSGFTVRWDGSGWAEAWEAPGSPPWQGIAVLAGGIVITSLMGAGMCYYAARQARDTLLGLYCSVVGLFLLTSGLSYAFWNGLQFGGPGDAARIFEMLRSRGFGYTRLVRSLWLIGSAALWWLSEWWACRILWRHIETQQGRGRYLSMADRALGVSTFLIVPGVIIQYISDPTKVLAPELGRLPNHVNSLVLAVIAGLIILFPRAPFATPMSVSRRSVLCAYAALGAIAVPVQLWWGDGWHWQSTTGVPTHQPTMYQELAEALRDASDLEEITRLAGVVEKNLSNSPRDDATAGVLVNLAFAWRRVHREYDALGCYERLGREWQGRALTALTLQVDVLRTAGNLGEAIARTERFVAVANAEERNTAFLTLVTLHIDLGDCPEALSVWERWVALSDGPGTVERINALRRIARCYFDRREEVVALNLLQARLVDRNESWYPAVAMDYAEYSGRSGKIREAREFIDRIPAERRPSCLLLINFILAWLSGDPAEAMDRLGKGNVVDVPMHDAVRLLLELPGSVPLLNGRIRAGEVIAIELAGFSERPEFINALRDRRAAGGPNSDSVTRAIARLELYE